VVVGAGGGLFVNAATGLIEHSTVADNHLGDETFAGGGMALLPITNWETHVTIRDSVFANHRDPSIDPGTASTAAIFAAADTSVEIDRILFANNLHDTNAGMDDPYNLPPGSYDITALLTATNAGFVDSDDADYRLTVQSPAVDQAIGSTLAVDLIGTVRPQGAAPDLGAYELVP